MKVLYWTERFWPHIGGIEILSLYLIKALQAKGYEFTVVTSHNARSLPDEDTYDGIPIYRFHFLTSLTSRNLKQLVSARQKLIRFKQTFKPDLVNIHFSGPSTYFHLQTAAAHSAPTLLTVHSTPTQLSENSRLLLKSFNAAQWITAPSKVAMARLRQLAPDIESRSSVIYAGVEQPNVVPQPLPFSPPRLLCIGRIVDWKGFDLALKAMPLVAAQFPGIQLVIVGDGPEKTNLEKLAVELKINHLVEFTGWIDPEQVPGLMNTATIVVIPSRDTGGETLPVVAIQAAQMGRPIIASAIVGLPEIVIHQQTGLLIEQNDHVGLAEAVSTLLNAPELTTQMGQAARQQAGLFSIEQAVTAYEALYHQLLN